MFQEIFGQFIQVGKVFHIFKAEASLKFTESAGWTLSELMLTSHTYLPS